LAFNGREGETRIVTEQRSNEARRLRAASLWLRAGLSLVWMAVSLAGPRAQGGPPLPPPRPSGQSQAQPAGAAAAPLPQSAKPLPTGPSDAAACLAKLGANHVEAQSVPAPPAPLGDCGISAPVRLTAIGLADGAALTLPDRPVLDCEFAGVFSAYVRELMAPLGAAMLGSPIAALVTGPGYECRGRNRVAGAKTSAHGQGIAIDLAEIVLTDHRRIAVARQTKPAD
jgi:hypothetical protein